MRKLTGSNDTLLPEFLATLDTPADVEQYVREYLGSGAAATSFASEFVRRQQFESDAADQSKAAGGGGGGGGGHASSTPRKTKGGAKGRNAAAGSSRGLTSEAGGKKKGKRKGAQVDPALLGFTSTTRMYEATDMD